MLFVTALFLPPPAGLLGQMLADPVAGDVYAAFSVAVLLWFVAAIVMGLLRILRATWSGSSTAGHGDEASR